MADARVESSLFEGTGISEEDKRDVLQQIDKIVEENKIPVTKDLFTIKPKRRGALFPIMINLIALLLAAGGLYGIFRYFSQKQETLSLETDKYLSAEGKLIEELKKESETKLKAKEAEISKIQDDLALLDRQSQDLRNNMEQTIRSKEDQLRRDMETELSAEREKLKAQGVSAAQIDAQLKALGDAKQQELNLALTSFRQENEAALQAKEQELQQAKSMTQEILARANQDKAQLQEDTLKREQELKTQYEQQASALRSQSAEAEARLKELSDLRAQEQLLLDQITGSYAAVQTKLAADDFDGARADLTRLRTIVNDRAFDTLPNLAKRKPVEMFLIQALTENLDTRTSSASPETTSIVEAANKLIAARELTARAEEALRQGRLEDAKRQYTKALQDVPAMFTAFEGLQQIRNAELSAGAENLVARAQSGAEKGTKDAELFEEYRQAILFAAGPARNQAAAALTKLEAAIAGMFTVEKNDALGQKDKQIADLERRLRQTADNLAQSNNNLAAREKDLADSKTAAANLQKDLNLSRTAGTDLDRQLAGARQELADARREAERLNGDLAGRRTEIADLQKNVADLNASLKAATGETGGQQNLIAQLRGQLDTKDKDVSRLESEVSTLESRLAAASSAASPAPAASSVTPSQLASEREAALKQGRDQALSDIIAYADYRSKNPGETTPAERQKIEGLAVRDFLYKTALERIESIPSAGGSADPVSAAAAEPKLIGTVASVSPGRIIVETLVNMQINSGALLIVKRKTRTSGEITIASGTVSSMAAGRITAAIDSIVNQSQPPMVMDLVYIRAEL